MIIKSDNFLHLYTTLNPKSNKGGVGISFRYHTAFFKSAVKDVTIIIGQFLTPDSLLSRIEESTEERIVTGPSV